MPPAHRHRPRGAGSHALEPDHSLTGSPGSQHRGPNRSVLASSASLTLHLFLGGSGFLLVGVHVCVCIPCCM
ncbi:unnamed protein product [Protopolystoma xenopodis]|uniref:Uncharacterized protein n=1 Tax=Protopolystoma xenopodis TaxID=117903 RepID=A0A3S5AY63_9PLAT|nr:unnamed protein product [Protopolystoma xenopodis]